MKLELFDFYRCNKNSINLHQVVVLLAFAPVLNFKTGISLFARNASKSAMITEFCAKLV